MIISSEALCWRLGPVQLDASVGQAVSRSVFDVPFKLLIYGVEAALNGVRDGEGGGLIYAELLLATLT